MKKLLLPLCIILSLCLVSCSREDYDDHNHPGLTTGEDFFNYHCSRCHRESGRGQVMKGIPPVTYAKLTHSQMRKLIINGHEGGEMQVFKNMPKEEARKITRYVKKLDQLAK